VRKLRILALMAEGMVPPDDVSNVDVVTAVWKMEFDVVQTLLEMGHEVLKLGVGSELGPIRQAIHSFKPHIAFNLVEAFDDVASWDQNVVAYLELLKLHYTGCNARGLLLGRDKAVCKKILSYHRIPVADFVVFPRSRKVKRPRRLSFPLIVKSLTLDASIGISQASVVEDDDKLQERVVFIHEKIGTDALVEQYIEGRELYVGVIGNHRLQVLPVWELSFANMPEESRKIATERLKWSLIYQKKHGIKTGAAELSEAEAKAIQNVCKRVYRNLLLSGYARIDLRLTEAGRVYVMEANPNPQLAYGEDFAESAERAGISYEQLLQRLLQRIVNLGLRWEPSRIG